MPSYRTDVALEEDLYEEILRIYGYDKIPTKTLSLEIPEDVTPDFIVQEDHFRQSAESVGLDEVINLPFIPKSQNSQNLNPEFPNFKTATLVNPPSPDTQYLRQSMYVNLLNNAQKVINERGEHASFFEIGKVYYKSKGSYFEKRRMAIIFWNKNSSSFASFKGLVLAFFNKAQFPEQKFESTTNNLLLENSYNLFVATT